MGVGSFEECLEMHLGASVIKAMLSAKIIKTLWDDHAEADKNFKLSATS